MALVARKTFSVGANKKYKSIGFECFACGHPYIFMFEDRMEAEEIKLWLEQRGWPITYPPLKFFCDDGCKASKAKEVGNAPGSRLFD